MGTINFTYTVILILPPTFTLSPHFIFKLSPTLKLFHLSHGKIKYTPINLIFVWVDKLKGESKSGDNLSLKWGDEVKVGVVTVGDKFNCIVDFK